MAEFVLTPQVKAQALRSMSELRGETVFIVSKQTSKPIRVGPGGNVTANGGLGPHARFKVRRGDRPHNLGPVVRFQNVATGKWLAIKNGTLTIGGGGDHCEFIVETKQAAVLLRKHHNPKARIGFNPNGQSVPANNLGEGVRARFFIFDCDQVAPANPPPVAQPVVAQAVVAQAVVAQAVAQPVNAGAAAAHSRAAQHQAQMAARHAQAQAEAHNRAAQHQAEMAARQAQRQAEAQARHDRQAQKVADMQARQAQKQADMQARQQARQQAAAQRQAQRSIGRTVGRAFGAAAGAVGAAIASVVTPVAQPAVAQAVVAQPVVAQPTAQAIPAAVTVAQPVVQIQEYRTNPDADGKGNAWYLDRHHVKVPAGQVLTGFHLTRPSGNTIQYQFWGSPTTRVGPEMATNTPANAAGGGSLIYLDRHQVMAPGNGLLTGFKLQRAVPTKYHYVFSFNPAAGVGPVLEQSTPGQVGKNAIYLDRQSVRAPVGYGLKGFQLYRPTGNTVAYKYWVQKIA